MNVQLKNLNNAQRLYPNDWRIRNNIGYLNKIDFLCDTKNQSCDAFDENGNITIMDSYHYTLQGAKFFGKKLYDKNMINF